MHGAKEVILILKAKSGPKWAYDIDSKDGELYPGVNTVLTNHLV